MASLFILGASIKMKLFSYIDDGLNYLIVNFFEKLSPLINLLILAFILVIIYNLHKRTWGEKK